MEGAGVATLAELVGREVESAVVEGIISPLPQGGGTLLVRGEVGIGKSALPDLGRTRARRRAINKRAPSPAPKEE
jgi:hypothetical protein